MKNYFGLILCSLALFSCGKSDSEQEKPTTPLSEQNLKFEIYDSLIIDHIGNLVLMDISPNGNNYLLSDQNSGDILITDSEGSILHQYNRTGDGPNDYVGNKSGRFLFRDNSSYLVPTTQGFSIYSLDGEKIENFKPEFSPFANLVVSFSTSIQLAGDQVFLKLQGRYADNGNLDSARNLERIDINTGEYHPIIPFPKGSKYLDPEANFQGFDYHPVFTVKGDSLYFLFRNDPTFYAFSLDNLETPARSFKLPIGAFEERDMSKEVEPGSFDMRDFLLGSFNSIDPIEDGEILIYYSSGLTDEKANEVISEAGTDFNQIFTLAEKYNTVGYRILKGESLSPIIEKDEILANMGKAISNEEIWFNLDFSQVENDYSVIYKTRIVPAN